MMAIRALGTIGGKKASEALAAALENEKDEKVREAIAESLK
jgi:HEAT repeat protein